MVLRVKAVKVLKLVEEYSTMLNCVFSLCFAVGKG